MRNYITASKESRNHSNCWYLDEQVEVKSNRWRKALKNFIFIEVAQVFALINVFLFGFSSFFFTTRNQTWKCAFSVLSSHIIYQLALKLNKDLQDQTKNENREWI